MAAPKILSVVGNRPQLVKAGPLLAALRESADVVAVDTGQHYDAELSTVFYEELGLPEPEFRLNVGSGSHGAMTARILERIEPVLESERPDVIVVYGDTNSTLAAALAAAKLGVPIAHVEAGLRSYDRAMPEEINRVLVDHLSTLLLAPTTTARANLAAEGLTAGVHVVGDVMADTARLFGPLAEQAANLGRYGVTRRGFVLATVHREANTRMPALGRLVDALSRLPEPVLIPLHPRTAAAMVRAGLRFAGAAQVLPPVGYLEFTALLRAARVLVTDSGGAQKEAYLHEIPCVTLRTETEWVETVDAGWNRLVGDDPVAILAAVAAAAPGAGGRRLYGDGHAAERIAGLVIALAQSTRGVLPGRLR